jgi:hypothetical protein
MELSRRKHLPSARPVRAHPSCINTDEGAIVDCITLLRETWESASSASTSTSVMKRGRSSLVVHLQTQFGSKSPTGDPPVSPKFLVRVRRYEIRLGGPAHGPVALWKVIHQSVTRLCEANQPVSCCVHPTTGLNPAPRPSMSRRMKMSESSPLVELNCSLG